jgi:hypothetical protein
MGVVQRADETLGGHLKSGQWWSPQIRPMVVTSNPANGGHLKTGQ